MIVNPTNFVALATEVLDKGHKLRFQARGSSMLPFICDGDILEIQPPDVIRRGDIILCRTQQGRVMVHRVHKVTCKSTKPTLYTRGDAAFHSDGIIPFSEVIGRVITLERKGRHISLDTWPFRPLGLLWLITFPISPWLYRLFVRIKQKVHR